MVRVSIVFPPYFDLASERPVRSIARDGVAGAPEPRWNVGPERWRRHMGLGLRPPSPTFKGAAAPRGLALTSELRRLGGSAPPYASTSLMHSNGSDTEIPGFWNGGGSL